MYVSNRSKSVNGGTGIDGTGGGGGGYLHVTDSNKKLVEDLMNVIWSV